MTHTLRALIWKADLAHRLDALAVLAQRCVRALSTAALDDDLPIGSTKLGGRPDLPPDVSWPGWHGHPLAFLGQLNLADLHGFTSAADLPTRGLLSFFYDAYEQPWGLGPDETGGWEVIYLPHPTSDLHRRRAPRSLPEASRFAPCSLHLYEAVSLPPSDSPLLDALDLDDEEWDRYHDLLFERLEFHPHATLHQLLGYPDPIQGDMHLHLTSRQHLAGTFDLDADVADRGLTPNAADWQLLLQLDSDDRAGMMWGDCGRLYFWLHRTDLVQRTFDRTQLVLQCY